ncbi:MAG TPA: RDD family protein, partial [Planctomycetota bacterium]
EWTIGAVEGSDRIEIAVAGMTGGVKRLELSPEGTLLSTRRNGSGGFPFGRQFLLVMLIPQAVMLLVPLVFAMVLSVMANRHRTSDYRNEELASMTARALAGTLDYLFLCLPAIPAILNALPMFLEDGPDPAAIAGMFTYVAAGMIGGLLLLLGFSVLEGLTGATPGKWIARIRVVGADDLRPCGVGRAFLRKLLLVADGFMNGMVGLLIAAFSEKRQRLGDLVAKTVVIRR